MNAVRKEAGPAPRYTVQKGVPIPPRKGGGGRKAECPYPFLDMVRGDSFLVKCANARELQRARRNASAWAKRIAKEHKAFRVTTRAMDGGLRVWRVG